MRLPVLAAPLLLLASLCEASSFHAAQAVLSEGAGRVFDGSARRAPAVQSLTGDLSAPRDLKSGAKPEARLSKTKVPAPRAARRRSYDGGSAWNAFFGGVLGGIAGALVGLAAAAIVGAPALGAALVGAGIGWAVGALMALAY